MEINDFLISLKKMKSKCELNSKTIKFDTLFDYLIIYFHEELSAFLAANHLVKYEKAIKPMRTADIRIKSKSSFKTSNVLEGVTRV